MFVCGIPETGRVLPESFVGKERGRERKRVR